MKNLNTSEVKTIFHPEKCQMKSPTYEEQPNNDNLDNSKKNNDNSDNLRQKFFTPEINICASSKNVELSGTGNIVINNGNSNQSIVQNQFNNHLVNADSTYRYHRSLSTLCESCCTASAKKIYFGICVTICVTTSWVGTTHCIKFLYFQKSHVNTNDLLIQNFSNSEHYNQQRFSFNAPFFTTWFFTNWTVLYFPIYFLNQSMKSKCLTSSEILSDSIRGFRDKGLTGGRFLTRCSLFCGLWVTTNYMYIHSLRILLATDVMTLFATNVACVYLLSWVILHEQFVGVRIVAVILCDTGIALLAYMDGITGSPTLGGVVLAASAAAGSAVYKVLFKKVIGDATFGQISLFFSMIGICNAALLWPICLVLYFSGVEYILWMKFPWTILFIASVLHLVANMLGNFSIAVTYNLFITLGLITAVPVSAALDVILYGANFAGMKLAGMILIATGFFLVMFPNNWPDYFTRLLRWSRRHRHGMSGGSSKDIIDYRTGYIKSHLRSPSGRVR